MPKPSHILLLGIILARPLLPQQPSLRIPFSRMVTSTPWTLAGCGRKRSRFATAALLRSAVISSEKTGIGPGSKAPAGGDHVMAGGKPTDFLK